MWDEQGKYIETTETDIKYTVCHTWSQMCDATWSPTEPLKDKDLVWCWDDDHTHTKALRFWDARNGSSFKSNGERDGGRWGNYEKFTGEWPEWAKEAVKTLED